MRTLTDPVEGLSLDDRQEANLLGLLDRIQRHIPLVDRPLAFVARDLGISEDQAVELLAAAKERGLVRQLSAIFDAGGLGYRSSLVAARYPAEHLDDAAAFISSYPGVSHNYQRQHDFNLWYTVAVPPGQSLDEVVSFLHERSGAASTRLLPTLRRFKLNVQLDMSGTAAADARDEPDAEATPAADAQPLSDAEIRAVRALQDDIPAAARPFDATAAREGFASAGELLGVGEDLRRRGVLRRFSAILRHRKAGFRANGMVVWEASEPECELAGPVMARFAKVTHCYQRPTYPDWPYSLFTMIHGREEGDVQEAIDAISAETGLSKYRVLYSTVEYKKRRVRYFTDEWEAWDRANGRGAAP